MAGGLPGRPKSYAGREVINMRWGNRPQHLVGTYRRYGRQLGIYSDTFDMFVEELVKRSKNDQQNVILCEGPTGSGKSTLAILLAMQLAKRLDTTFDLDKDYIYGAKDMWHKLDEEKASPVSLIDEGTLSLNTMNFRRKDDTDLVVLFDTMRSRHWTTFICAPNVRQINPTVRRLHVDFKCECSGPDNQFVKGYERGFFEVTNKAFSRRKRYDPDPYWNVLTTGIFGTLPNDIDRKYQKIKSKRQEMLIRDGIKRKLEKDEDGNGEESV